MPGIVTYRRGPGSIGGHGAGHSWRFDCQVDCQPFELALFSLDCGRRLQAADLLIWTAMDGAGQVRESYESAGLDSNADR